MDFPDLRKKNLKQKIRKVGNRRERKKILNALIWLDIEGVLDYINKIEGVEYIEAIPKEIDCFRYIIRERDPKSLVPGILEHKGIPEPGDFVIYGKNLQVPRHIGIWQEKGDVISKWGDYGPVMRHEWNKILPFYGKYMFFSDHKLLE